MTLQEIIAEVQDNVHEAERLIATGISGWFYVRLYPDGSILSGVEVSQATPESEYFDRPGAPTTVWSRQSSGCRSEDWTFEWDDVSDAEASTHTLGTCNCVHQLEDYHRAADGMRYVRDDEGLWRRVSDRFCEPDWTDLDADLAERVEDYLTAMGGVK